MNTNTIRKKIHEYVDQADERFLRLVYSMVKSEEGSSEADLFDTTTEDMINRAKASLSSVEQGKTRNIREFKQEIDTWKKKLATR